MCVVIILFKLYLKSIYFFLKIFKTNDKKVLLLSRQYDKKTLDYTMIKNNINRRYPQYKVIILAKKLNKKNIVQYFFHIHNQMYHLATSRICVVDTYIIPVSILKHKKQLTIIQLCHGIGNLKKFGYQTLKKKSGKNEKISKLMNMHYSYDYLISTGKETSKFYCEAFNMTMDKMLNFGPPKIDAILKVKKERKKILKKYPYLKNKPTILYVCTFRTYKSNHIKKFVEGIPSNKYNIIIHIHPVQYKYFPKIDDDIKNKSIYRFPDISTSDLLSVCDVAITDYSSFVFESSILKIPTYLYVPDYEKYIKYNGLNVDIFKELPGCVFKDSKELFQKIKQNKYNFKVLENFKNKYIEVCDGTSTNKLVDFMINIKKTN